MFKNLFSRRCTEPSTWGGVAILLGGFGLSFDEAQAVTNALAGVSAAVAVFMPEKKESE